MTKDYVIAVSANGAKPFSHQRMITQAKILSVSDVTVQVAPSVKSKNKLTAITDGKRHL